jgi:hypothetical protein
MVGQPNHIDGSNSTVFIEIPKPGRYRQSRDQHTTPGKAMGKEAKWRALGTGWRDAAHDAAQ